METIYNTVKKKLCVGCGICNAVCPCQAINMTFTEYKEFRPVIAVGKCNQCYLCARYCPMNQEKLIDEANKICSGGMSYGLDNSQYLLTFEKNVDNRKKSASGGFTSAFAKELLNNGIIDFVIHAEYKEGKIGEIHYKASLSERQTEIDLKRGSFYFPIEYSEILLKFRKTKKKLLIIGVPCIIRGLLDLFNNHQEYKQNNIYTIALACSHNVSGQFIDFLAESLKIDKTQLFMVNLRNKDNIKDANSFNNYFYTNQGELKKINRFDSVFTKTWRNYFFSLNACHYCSDFWGYSADISVKDAWGKWAVDPLGKNIVVVRNSFLMEFIKNMKDIEYEYLDFDTISNCQSETIQYKQVKAIYRLMSPILNKQNINSGFFKYWFLSNTSKFCYKYLGFNITKLLLYNSIFFIERLNQLITWIIVKFKIGLKQDDYFKYGLELFRKGKYKACIRFFKKEDIFLEHFGPSSIVRYFYIGSAFEKLKKYTNALEYFRKAEKGISSLDDVMKGTLYYHIAYCKENISGMDNDVINYYKNCLSYIPDHIKAKQKLAQKIYQEN